MPHVTTNPPELPPQFSANKRSPISSPSGRVDLEHPWLGLDSFGEENRHYFFGREAEVAEIHLRVRTHPLLVFYGRSGLGKTSILNAGLVPKLREEGGRPTVMRLRYTANMFERQMARLLKRSTDTASSFGPCLQIAVELSHGGYPSLSGLEASMKWWVALARELKVALPDDTPSLLWLRLHYRADLPSVTHLILDQFEEVFTLSARAPGAENEVRDALAILLHGVIPKPIAHLISEHSTFLEHFDPDQAPVRVILTLRDDYVYALNRWKRHIPALGQNTFELRALRGPAAFEAVFKPGQLRCQYRGEVEERNKADTDLPPIVDSHTAHRIVRFIARKGKSVFLKEIDAVPPVLSLLCRELNERRFTEPWGTADKPADRIVFDESGGDIELIIASFYERCLQGRPEAVRIFIEDELVSYSGARLQQDEKSILTVFDNGCLVQSAEGDRCAAGYGDTAAAQDCLDELVSERLLTALGGETSAYELTHDLLAAVAEKSRTAREQRHEAERANRRAETESKAREDAQARERVAAEHATELSKARKEAELNARAAADRAVQLSKMSEEKNRANRRANWLAIAASVATIFGVLSLRLGNTQTDSGYVGYVRGFLAVSLPIIGAWVGTVLAYYFTKSSYKSGVQDAATFAEALTDIEKPTGIFVTQPGIMIPVAAIDVPAAVRGKRAGELSNVLLKELRSQMRHQRLPLLDPDTGTPLAVIHKSLIDNFLVQQAIHVPGNLETATLEQLLADPESGRTAKSSFVVVPNTATLADVKDVMTRQSWHSGVTCEDAFILEPGSPRVEGWITNDIIVANSMSRAADRDSHTFDATVLPIVFEEVEARRPAARANWNKDALSRSLKSARDTYDGIVWPSPGDENTLVQTAAYVVTALAKIFDSPELIRAVSFRILQLWGTRCVEFSTADASSLNEHANRGNLDDLYLLMRRNVSAPGVKPSVDDHASLAKPLFRL